MNVYLGTFFILVLALSLLAIAPVNSIPEKIITKSLDPDEGGLGTVVTVTLTIEGTGDDESVIVTDALKGTGFSYIPLSASITPKSTKKGLIIFTLTEDAEITFEVKVTEAYAWDDMVVENEAIAVWSDGTEDSATAEFTIKAFESLDKGVGDDLAHETNAILGENTEWTLYITVDNPFGFIMEDAVIKDRFGAEIEIDDYDAGVWYTDGVTQGRWQYKTKGNSDKVFLTWEIGDLAISGTATLTLEISTDLNPAGHQEYTELGEKELNSGATLKFIDPDQDMQLSAYTGSITVDVEEVD